MPPPHRRNPAQQASRNRQRLAKVDPIRLGRAIKQRKAAGLVIALLLILSIALLDRWAGVLPVGNDWHRYHEQTFEVARVIDGDTIELRIPDGQHATTRVRLWGVNTPEMNHKDPDTLPAPLAEEATAFTRESVAGERVTVLLQEHRMRGGYGRLLAYIELPNGDDLSARLIETGLSEHDDRWGHDRAAAYEALEQQARKGRRGLWGPRKP